jgi:metal-responsive CopG/Arc/MetJ family transcriptional regulator
MEAAEKIPRKNRIAKHGGRQYVGVQSLSLSIETSLVEALDNAIEPYGGNRSAVMKALLRHWLDADLETRNSVMMNNKKKVG